MVVEEHENQDQLDADNGLGPGVVFWYRDPGAY